MPLCFDLDGTLGTFGGGYVLLREALGELWGTSPEDAELRRCGGSTDWEIVDELHRNRYGRALDDRGFAAFEARCLARFEASFHPTGRQPVRFAGILAALDQLVEEGCPVWLVSGNAPRVLAFKAQALGISSRVSLQGSLPKQDRAGLLRLALRQAPGPHWYVGDRPHDLQAAEALGIPFLGIGAAVPGPHPSLPEDATAEAVVGLLLA